MNFIESFVEAIPQSGKVLDLGAGKGNWSKHFRAMGHEIVAVDRTPRPSELTPEIDWLVVDLADDVPILEPASIDAIFARNVVQFIKKARFASDIVPFFRRTLNAGGIIGIETFYQEPTPTFGGIVSLYTTEDLRRLFPDTEILFEKQFSTTGTDLKGEIRKFFVSQLIVRV